VREGRLQFRIEARGLFARAKRVERALKVYLS